ncbi:hypothetical protein Lal_00045401, partial [Lupinus albus]
TPDLDSRIKKQSVLNSKSPHPNSRRKRRAQRSPHSIPTLPMHALETMEKHGVYADTVTYSNLIKCWLAHKTVREGQHLHHQQILHESCVGSGLAINIATSGGAKKAQDRHWEPKVGQVETQWHVGLLFDAISFELLDQSEGFVSQIYFVVFPGYNREVDKRWTMTIPDARLPQKVLYYALTIVVFLEVQLQ